MLLRIWEIFIISKYLGEASMEVSDSDKKVTK